MKPLAILVALALCSNATTYAADSSASKGAIAEINMQRLAKKEVESVIKDPSSAQFRNQKGGCGEVNSKNSFGSYTGFQRFIAGKNIVVLERDTGIPAAEFQQAWNQLCK